MLCEACAGVITEREGAESTILEGAHKAWGHQHTIKDLYKAAIAECYICGQLFRNWERWYWLSIEGGPKGASEAERDRTMIVEVTEEQQRDLREKYEMDRTFAMQDDDHVSRYSISRLINQDSSAREITFTATARFFNPTIL